jgi:hypothetical protein
VEGAGREVKLPHGRLRQTLGGGLELAVLPHLGWSRRVVGRQLGAGEASPLPRPGLLDPLLDESPRRSSANFPEGTQGTSRWVWIRSSRGPERRFW